MALFSFGWHLSISTRVICPTGTDARQLIARLDLEGELVSLDPLHSCQETARQIVLDAGADYAMTIKDNTPGIKKRIVAKLPDPGSPLLSLKRTPAAAPGTDARKKNANGSSGS